MSDKKELQTRLIHGRFRSEKWDYSCHAIPPKTASTTFRLESADRGRQGFIDFMNPCPDRDPIYVYDRLDEPNCAMLEEILKDAEEGDSAIVFSCGMAAIAAALMTCAQSGDNIIAHSTMYGCTYSLLSNWLPRFGISTRFLSAGNKNSLEQAMDDNTRVIYLETPANPTLECVDLAQIRQLVDQRNQTRPSAERIRIVVDNTFATFWAQRPLSLGADLVVMSLTKNMGGFGVDMGGAVVCQEDMNLPLRLFRKDFGGVLPPGSAWNIMVYGISTLGVRMGQQVATAAKIADFLQNHPKVHRVYYPGLESFPSKDIAKKQLKDPQGNFCPGYMLYFELKGTPEEAHASCERLIDHIAEHSYAITLAVSLGMTKTLIEAPGVMTHCALDPQAQLDAGIHPGGVRMSMGLEDPADILQDLAKALDAC